MQPNQPSSQSLIPTDNNVSQIIPASDVSTSMLKGDAFGNLPDSDSDSDNSDDEENSEEEDDEREEAILSQEELDDWNDGQASIGLKKKIVNLAHE